MLQFHKTLLCARCFQCSHRFHNYYDSLATGLENKDASTYEADRYCFFLAWVIVSLQFDPPLTLSTLARLLIGRRTTPATIMRHVEFVKANNVIEKGDFDFNCEPATLLS